MIVVLSLMGNNIISLYIVSYFNRRREKIIKFYLTNNIYFDQVFHLTC